jgi:NADPH2:quinone reductase
MRAVRQHAYGSPFVVEEVPPPEAGPKEVVVTVTAAAVNPLDVWIARGTVPAAGPLPRTAGCEGAGRTPDGRRVVFRGAGLGLVRDGAWAEQVAVPLVHCVDVPDGVDDASATSLGIAGITALDALDLGQVSAPSTVVVLGASGGVGDLACQLARARGATVIAQTGTPGRTARLSRVADHVVVADDTGLAEAVRSVAPDGVDVVLDGLSGGYTGQALELLKPFGRIVVYGASAGPTISFGSQSFYRRNASVIGYSGLAHGPGELAWRFGVLLAEVAAGRLEVTVADRLGLEDANEAVERLAARRVGGKLVLVP